MLGNLDFYCVPSSVCLPEQLNSQIEETLQSIRNSTALSSQSSPVVSSTMEEPRPGKSGAPLFFLTPPCLFQDTVDFFRHFMPVRTVSLIPDDKDLAHLVLTGTRKKTSVGCVTRCDVFQMKRKPKMTS